MLGGENKEVREKRRLEEEERRERGRMDRNEPKGGGGEYKGRVRKD